MRYSGAIVAAVLALSCSPTGEPPVTDGPAPGAPIGERVTVFTHCGFYEMEFDGVVWTPDSIARGAFPPGTDPMATEGVIRRLGDKLVFLADSGLEVTYAPAPPDLPPEPPCD